MALTIRLEGEREDGAITTLNGTREESAIKKEVCFVLNSKYVRLVLSASTGR